MESVLTSDRIAAVGDLPLDDDCSLCYSNILKGMYKSKTILSKQVHALVVKGSLKWVYGIWIMVYGKWYMDNGILEMVYGKSLQNVLS